MATRGLVGKVEGDEVKYIYTHWDNYPYRMKGILTEHYSTDKQIEELLSLGDASIIHESLDKSEFYERDRRETNVDAKTVLLSELGNTDSIGAEYFYVFNDGKWYWNEIDWRKAKLVLPDKLLEDYKEIT